LLLRHGRPIGHRSLPPVMPGKLNARCGENARFSPTNAHSAALQRNTISCDG
jgi:hypothetical protein